MLYYHVASEDFSKEHFHLRILHVMQASQDKSSCCPLCDSYI